MHVEFLGLIFSSHELLWPTALRVQSSISIMLRFCHVPMITQIRRFWIPPVADSQMTGISMKQRELGRQAFLTQDANWQTFMHDSARALSPLLQRAMFTCINDPDSFVTDLHVAARTCYRQFSSRK